MFTCYTVQSKHILVKVIITHKFGGKSKFQKIFTKERPLFCKGLD